MSAPLDQIEQDALALPPEQRAQLVDKLWDSLGDTTYPALTENWRAEIERRRQQLANGQAVAVPGEAVSRRAREIAGPSDS
jgi:putative addiction module component (TIGR02574 family)